MRTLPDAVNDPDFSGLATRDSDLPPIFVLVLVASALAKILRDWPNECLDIEYSGLDTSWTLVTHQ